MTSMPTGHWYYRIEVAPGVFTPGVMQPTLALVREALRRIDVQEAACLDIGTQDFAVPIELNRLKAKHVVCYDRLSKLENYEFLKRLYNLDATYVHGVPLGALAQSLASLQTTSFDVVVFAGVLYHMVDPLAGLALARRFVREGGLLVLETAASFKQGHGLDFNARGRLYGDSSNYFLPRLETLDYICRMLRLEPIDFQHWGSEVGRTLTVLRAVDHVLPDGDDVWMTRPWIEQDFWPFGLHYDQLRSTLPAVPYRQSDARHLAYRRNGCLDLYRSQSSSPATQYREDLASVFLDA